VVPSGRPRRSAGPSPGVGRRDVTPRQGQGVGPGGGVAGPKRVLGQRAVPPRGLDDVGKTRRGPTAKSGRVQGHGDNATNAKDRVCPVVVCSAGKSYKNAINRIAFRAHAVGHFRSGKTGAGGRKVVGEDGSARFLQAWLIACRWEWVRGSLKNSGVEHEDPEPVVDRKGSNQNQGKR